MEHPGEPSPEMQELRRRAEARLRDQAPDVEALSAKEARKLVRELQTTQIELEIQNEELRRAQEELAAARDRYADLFDHAPVGYVTLDAGGRIQEANLTFADLLSRERERLIGEPFARLVAESDLAMLAPTLRSTQPGESRRSSNEVRIQRVDRTPFWAAIEVVPEARAGGVQTRCTVTDITVRKEAESEHADREGQLRLSERLEAVGQLAGGVAHEFNNSLSVVLGYGELLLDKLHDADPLRDYVEQILDAGRRSAGVTRQLLAFGRRQTLQPELRDLNERIDGMAGALELLLTEDISLDLELSGKPARVWVDPGRLDEIITSLTINAREAMPEGGSLKITTAAREIDEEEECRRAGVEPGNYVALTFEDTGRGMDPVTLSRIFDPFYSTKATAAGLRMSAVYGLLRQSGGNIRAESEADRGTVFEILLPVAQSRPRP